MQADLELPCPHTSMQEWPICHVTANIQSNPSSLNTDGSFTMAFLALMAQLDAHPAGDQEVAGSTLAGSAAFFNGD